MNLKMCSKICKNCPFGKNAAAGWLGPHTVDEILGFQQMEGLFACHMVRLENMTYEDIQNGKYPICRGFIASASASFKLFGQHPVFGKPLAELQKEITDEDEALVMNKWDFRKHHEITDSDVQRFPFDVVG